MGRFETLNADTQDLVNCLLPALAKSFGLTDCVDIIPEDIRMRAWDCERRDHIKDQTENDPRNWGVQFLKDLMAISRIKNGDLNAFQDDLRTKVEAHKEKHPWCRLSDIKEIKDHYQNPNRPPPAEIESAATSSTDSYLEELHEPDMPGGKRGRQRNHEVYEARVQESHKRRKYGSHGRLRRSEEGGFIRKEKKGSGKNHKSSERATPTVNHRLLHRRKRTVESDGDDSIGSVADAAFVSQPTPSFSMSPAPGRAATAATSAMVNSINTSREPLHVLRMQAELEVAEAELKAARVRYDYIQAKERAEAEAGGNSVSAATTPQNVN